MRARRAALRRAALGALASAGLALAQPAAAADHLIRLMDAPPFVEPQSLEIAVGDSVTWRNVGPQEIHALTDEAQMLFSADLPVGEASTFTFRKAGTYPFVCYRHHFMRGTVTVRNPDGSLDSAPDHPYQPAFHEFPVPTRAAVPRMIIVDHRDASIWYTEGGGGFYGFEDFPARNKIGHLRSDGSQVEFATPTPDGDATKVGVDSLVMDAEGVVWFTERLTNRIGRLDDSGLIREYEVPTEGGYALGIDIDRRGNLWFAERYGNRLGRLTPAGEFREFELPESASEPRTVFVDSRGRVWYTARTANEIGYFDPATETFTRLQIPTELARPTGIAETRDGAIYFVEMVGNKIGRVVGDQITEFPIPTKFSAPFKIVADAHDNLWFTQVFGNSIGRLDPDSGEITEYVIPTPDSRPGGITIDGQGRLWFAEQVGNKIAMFDPARAEELIAAAAAAPAPSAAQAAGGPEGPAADPSTSGHGFHIVDFELPSPGAGPGNDLVEDANGTIWFNQVFGNRIAAFHPDTRTFREVELPTAVSMPVGLARDQDGMLWTTEFRANRLARIDPDSGETREFEIPVDAALPSGVTVASDGAVWMTLLGANSIARFTPASGAFDRFEVPVTDSSPLMIAAGADGLLWITLTEERGNLLASFDPRTARFETFPLPTPAASPTGLLLDGQAVWVAEGGAGKLARFDRGDHGWEEFEIPAEHTEPVKLAKDRLGRIWLTDGGGLAGSGGNRLIVFDPREKRFHLIPMSREGAKPRGILAAKDGSIWFSQQNANLLSQVIFR